MKPVRIIPRLDVKGQNLVKGINLEGLRVLGLPERFAERYFLDGADELIYIDAVASLYGRNSLDDVVRRTSEKIFIPITVGGGIRTIDDIRRLLRAGADKVAINTAAIQNEKFISEAAHVFGSQCIIVSIAAIKKAAGQYEAYTDYGRIPSGKEVISWARRAEELGAGEILITSIGQDGTGGGYDVDLVSAVANAVKIPVIACGGAGNSRQVEEVIRKSSIDAVSAASLFHYNVLTQMGIEKREEGNVEYLKKFVASSGSILKKIEPTSIADLKSHLAGSGIPCVSAAAMHRTFNWDPAELPNILKQASPSVVLVDYGRSNMFSVNLAMQRVGARVEISDDPARILKADKLLVAGVGAFGDGMQGLRDRGLIPVIKEFVRSGKPVLGICLGMQLFMTEGVEFGVHPGLGLIPGRTVRLAAGQGDDTSIRIPHVGWNIIQATAGGPDWSNEQLLAGCNSGDFLYFVHSFAVVPDNAATIVAETRYGNNTFCSVIRDKNVIGCQFHPERSGAIGLTIYKNFVFHC